MQEKSKEEEILEIEEKSLEESRGRTNDASVGAGKEKQNKYVV